MVMSILAYGFCKAYRFYVKSQRDAMLQPPFDLSGGIITYILNGVKVRRCYFVFFVTQRKKNLKIVTKKPVMEQSSPK